MAQGGNAIPIAKMLTPGGPDPWRFVTPLGYEWWEEMTPLEQAHREHRLRCPHCNRQLLYCCGEVMAPYFRHQDGSCLTDGSAGGVASPRTRARATMIRYRLARLLLELLPTGTGIDEERAFLGAEEDLLFTLPDGRQFIAVVECSPDGYETLAARQVQYLAREIPVFWVFAGDLLYRQIREAGPVVDTRLDPLPVSIMQWGDVRRPGARPYVDVAYTAATAYPFLKAASGAEPGQLLFYQPGGQQDQLGTLIGLRGILPAPVHENRWAGAVVCAEITCGQAAPVRFSLRRGFYFEQDLVVLKAYRKQLNAHRVELRARKAREDAAAQLRAQQEEERRRLQAAIRAEVRPDPPRPQPSRPGPSYARGGGRPIAPERTYTKPVQDGMVQGCPAMKHGPVKLHDCKFCDCRAGGDLVDHIVCGWPRRQ